MAYKLKQNLSARGNYGDKRSLDSINYAVVHYTGNDGDTDENNGKYFKNNVVECSAHYFIDNDSITQSVPDNYVAWAVGSMGLLDQGSPYASKGGKYFGKCTNTNSISFELCDPVRGGGIKLNKEVRENAVKFIAKKMVELDIPAGNLIRHFDVNGKLCPVYFVTAEQDWLEFKAEVKAEINRLKGNSTKTETNKTTTTTTNTNNTSTSKGTTLPKLPTRGYFDIGDNGTQVKHLQRLLNYLIDAGLEVDGIIGELTIAAVEKFQKRYSLEIDGLFGSECLKKAKSILKKSGKLKYTETLPTLPKRGYFKIGDSGTQVKRLQEFLNWYADYGLEVDGELGEKTYAAVKKFQKAEGLVVDGEFGTNSLKKAKKYK